MVGTTISCMIRLWLHDPLVGVEPEVRGRGHGPHPPGVRSLVAVQGPLVVLDRGHGDHPGPVGEDEERHLLALQELLHDDLLSRRAEDLLLAHHFFDRDPRVLGLFDDEGTLARGKPVGLHRIGVSKRCLLHEGEGVLEGPADLEAGRGDVVPRHELTGEGLRALDLRGAARGTEDRELSPDELVADAQDHGQLGAHDGEVRLDGLSEVGDLDDARGVDRDTVRNRRDPGVSRGAVKLFH
jgi:hypothetical protein